MSQSLPFCFYLIFYVYDIFLLKIRILFFFLFVYAQIFSGILLLIKVRKSFFSDVVKHMLLENIHMHSLNLLIFFYIVFDSETAQESCLQENWTLDLFSEDSSF